MSARLSVGLSWSGPRAYGCFPIETVRQSEGGFEGVYQSSRGPQLEGPRDAAGADDGSDSLDHRPAARPAADLHRPARRLPGPWRLWKVSP